jgi:UDP-2,3-diacylglucosamine pyrophosphatase LpxH
VPFFVRASKLSQEKYDQAIAKGLDRAFDGADQDEIQLPELKVVIFSDLHRGSRDGADDFERGEPAYCSALGYYLERGFQLWLLGDVEELWENDIDEVLPKYQSALKLERDFALGPGLRRFWGNHDLDWKNEKRAKELAPYLEGVEVREALCLTVLDGSKYLGAFFLAHGHQGTDFSERFSFLSRLALRRVWRKVQASQGWLSTTPAKSYGLRYRHDQAMHAWARRRAMQGGDGMRPVLIAGHTHHPVFPGNPPESKGAAEAARFAEQLAAANAAGDVAQAAELRARLEYVQSQLRQKQYDPSRIDPPCYFNSGCCCFPDGDVTCLELDGEKIRLLRWPNDEDTGTPKELATPWSIREVMAQMAASD